MLTEFNLNGSYIFDAKTYVYFARDINIPVDEVIRKVLSIPDGAPIRIENKDFGMRNGEVVQPAYCREVKKERMINNDNN